MSKPASLPRQIPVGVLSLVAGVVILACCVGWAFLAQTLVTPACDLPELPPNVNLIICDDLMELIEPGD